MMMNETMENDSDNCAFPPARGARVPLFHWRGSATPSTCAAKPRFHAARGARGFTLIELMIVIVVICILAASTFKIMGNMEKSDRVAKVKARMEKVALALEAYKAIYGKYPPVFGYDENVGTKSDGSDDIVGQPCWFEFPAYDYINYPTWDETSAGQVTRGDEKKEVPWGECHLFTFGLASFLIPRYYVALANGCQNSFLGLSDENGDHRIDQETWGEADRNHIFGQWKMHNRRRADSAIGDSARDIAAARKILPYLDVEMDMSGGVNLGGSVFSVTGKGGTTERFAQPRELTTGGGAFQIPVCSISIWDGWDDDNTIYEPEIKQHRALRYVSRPPYEAYELRSSGPDRKFYTSDDIVIGGK